jgi:hypothetical protein
MKKGIINGLIITAVVAVLVIFFMRSCGKGELGTMTGEQVLQTVHDTVMIHKTDTETIYKKDVAEVESIKELVEILRGDTSKNRAELLRMANKIEAISNELKDSKSTIESLLFVNNEANIKLNDLQGILNDSVYSTTFKSKIGDWYDGAVAFSLKEKTFDVGVNIRDSLVVSEVNENGKRFFKYYNANPYSQNQSMNYFEIQNPPLLPTKQRRWGLGLSFGYGGLIDKSSIFHHGWGGLFGITYRVL